MRRGAPPRQEVPRVPSRRNAALLLAALAAASASGVPSEAASSAGDSGAFVMTLGSDTSGLERFTRTAGRAEGTLLFVPTSLRFDYALELLPDGTVRRMENTVRPASAAAGSNPTQRATLEWKADSVIADVTPGGLQRLASEPGAM